MTLIDLIVCDDIRHEINRKVTLVGVYGDTISFIAPPGQTVTWPVAVKLGLFIRLKVASSGEIRPDTLFELKCLHNGSELARFEGTILPKEQIKQVFALPLSAIFPLPGPGFLTFKLKLKHNNAVYQEFSPDRSIEITEHGDPNLASQKVIVH